MGYCPTASSRGCTAYGKGSRELWGLHLTQNSHTWQSSPYCTALVAVQLLSLRSGTAWVPPRYSPSTQVISSLGAGSILHLFDLWEHSCLSLPSSPCFLGPQPPYTPLTLRGDLDGETLKTQEFHLPQEGIPYTKEGWG